MTLEERVALGLKYPDAFIRGFYEAEGTLVRHHGRLDLTMYDTHANGAIIDAIFSAITSRGIRAHRWRHVGPKGIQVYKVAITNALDIRRFLAWTMPCMKTAPRKESEDPTEDEMHVNTEPILDRDVEAGVENTNVVQNGEQVGCHPAMGDMQPSEPSQGLRCIPTCMETCREQQKWPAPGTVVTFL